jgi:signal transduction histidine kinase
MKYPTRNDSMVQRLSGRLIRAVEDERKHLARELHDDIGQRLSLISVQLSSFNESRAKAVCDFDVELADVLRELDSVIADVHNLSHSLHSTRLEHLGLGAALSELCLKISKHHHIQVDLRAEGIPDDLDPDVALCFYRVAQEALSNVVKHSRSPRAEIAVDLESEILRMRIADSGVGYEAEAAPEGLGVATMEERLRAIVGTFSLDSTPGVGTTITAEAPIHGRTMKYRKEELAS